MLLRALGLAAAVAVLAGCGGGSKPAASSGPTFPPGCSVAETDAIVTAFLTHPTLAPAGIFQGIDIADPGGKHFATTSRAAALAHLAARIAAGERDRLLSLRVSPVDINRVDVVFGITRYAPDFAKTAHGNRLAAGSGSIDCAHGLVSAWVVRPT